MGAWIIRRYFHQGNTILYGTCVGTQAISVDS